MSLLSRYESLRLRVSAELSVEFPVCLVLEVSKPQAAVKVQEAVKKPKVTDKTEKLEKKVTPKEETKPGIQTRFLKELIPTLCVS